MKKKLIPVHVGTTTEILLLEIFRMLEEILWEIKELKKEENNDKPRKVKKTDTE